MHASAKIKVKTLFIIVTLSQGTWQEAIATEQRQNINIPSIWSNVPSKSPQDLCEPSIWRVAITEDRHPKKKELLNAFVKDCKEASDKNDKIPQHSKNSDTLRIATWNVFNWSKVNNESECSSGKILDSIKKINPDALMLQEVCNKESFSIESLKHSLQAQGYNHSIQLDPNKCGKSPYFNRGNMIFSKYPIIQSESHVFHTQEKIGENRGWQRATIKLTDSGDSIDVINTHLDVFNILNGKRTAVSGAVRIKEAQALLRSIKESDNVLIGGDFNCIDQKEFKTDSGKKYLANLRKYYNTISENTGLSLPDSDALDIFSENEFISVFNHLEWEEPLFTTWTATSVDKILAHKYFKHRIIGAYVYHPEEPQSDHLPIIVDVEIREKPSIVSFFTLVRYYRFSNILRKWINC